jgi:hypothetical protein
VEKAKKGLINPFQLGPREPGWSEVQGRCTEALGPLAALGARARGGIEVKSKGATAVCPSLSPVLSSAQLLNDHHWHSKAGGRVPAGAGPGGGDRVTEVCVGKCSSNQLG